MSSEREIQLIEGGIGIRSDQIFCSSLEEQGIPPGVDFKSFIKEKLGEAKVVIALVSPQYYGSAFCMCELGATWALTKSCIPLIVPPVTCSDLRGGLFGSQALPIDEDKKLDVMHSVIAALAQKAETVARLNSRKSQFLKQVAGALKQALSRLQPCPRKKNINSELKGTCTRPNCRIREGRY
jgi:TIR domain